MATTKASKGDTMRAGSVCQPVELHTYLLQEAEKLGATVGDVMRDALVHFLEQQALNEQLAQLEARFFRKVFEAQCAVAGLTASEHEQALRDIKQSFKENRP